MIQYQRFKLSDFINSLLSTGRVVFTAEEAEQALQIGHGAFLDAAERLQRRKLLLKPRQGFYIVVPAQFLSWGAPPPTWYIDALMDHEGAAYYIGLLKAAELHGATHQAVMEFQVVTAIRLPVIRAGRSQIIFFYRKDIEAISAGIEDYKTDTGKMKISSVALTLFDLLRYPRASGGIDNIATVLSELGQKIDSMQLASLSALVERPVVQRLGYLLEHFGYDTLSEPLFHTLQARGSLCWTELDRQMTRESYFTPKPRLRDLRWRIIVRRIPNIDT